MLHYGTVNNTLAARERAEEPMSHILSAQVEGGGTRKEELVGQLGTLSRGLDLGRLEGAQRTEEYCEVLEDMNAVLYAARGSRRMCGS